MLYVIECEATNETLCAVGDRATADAVAAYLPGATVRAEPTGRAVAALHARAPHAPSEWAKRRARPLSHVDAGGFVHMFGETLASDR